MLPIAQLLSSPIAAMAVGFSTVVLIALALNAVDAARQRAAAEKLGSTRKVHRLATTLPLLENTLDLIRRSSRMHHFVTEACARLKGEPLLIKSFGVPDILTVCTPQAVEDVIKTQFENFPKGKYMSDIFHDILGNGIFAVDGHKWLQQRKTATNLFTTRGLRDSMTGTIQEHARELYRIFQRASSQGKPLDLARMFSCFTLEAFTEIAFGVRMGCLDAENEHPFQTAFDEAQRASVQRFIVPRFVWKTLEWAGIGLQGRFPRNLNVINSTVLDIIKQTLDKRMDGSSAKSKDIISLFVDSVCKSPDADVKDLDPVFLRDLVINFLIAGRDTSAQTLSWFFCNLSLHPRVEAEIRKEMVKRLPALVKGETDNAEFEQTDKLVYLEAVIKETLRLHPAVPFSTKHTVKDTVLSDGTFVAAGTMVGIPMYAMGRMEHIWGLDATEFRPERWIDPTTGRLKTISSFQFISFNAGPRSCIGMKLAMLEIKLVVVGILSKFHVDVQDPKEATYEFSVSLPVKGAMNAKISAI